jgi:hypothetical protein
MFTAIIAFGLNITDIQYILVRLLVKISGQCFNCFSVISIKEHLMSTWWAHQAVQYLKQLINNSGGKHKEKS